MVKMEHAFFYAAPKISTQYIHNPYITGKKFFYCKWSSNNRIHERLKVKSIFFLYVHCVEAITEALLYKIQSGTDANWANSSTTK